MSKILAIVIHCNNSPRERKETLLDTLVCLGTRLEKPQSKLVGECAPLVERDGSLLLVIALVPDQDLVDPRRSVLLDIGMPSADI